MRELASLAVLTALGFGIGFGDENIARSYRESRPTLPMGPPPPLTKRQKRRLRGKLKEARRASHD